jgi:hypothetical protein
MERRRAERKTVNLETELVSGGKSFAGVIGNVSENGVYVKTSFTNTAIDFLPTRTLELIFRISSEETMHLYCEIIWLYSKKIQHPRLENESVLENDIGMDIKNSPQEYENFLENLQ